MISGVNEFSRKLTHFTGVTTPLMAQRIQRALGFMMGRGVVLKTPVDTALTRGRWQIGVGQINTSADGREDESGAASLGRIQAGVNTAPAYSVIYISNSAPQIMTLERGGYVPANPIDSPDANARRAARRNDRQRARAQAKYGDPGRPFVADGFSKQAPVGMVAVTLQEVAHEAERVARAIAAGAAP